MGVKWGTFSSDDLMSCAPPVVPKAIISLNPAVKLLTSKMSQTIYKTLPLSEKKNQNVHTWLHPQPKDPPIWGDPSFINNKHRSNKKRQYSLTTSRNVYNSMLYLHGEWTLLSNEPATYCFCECLYVPLHRRNITEENWNITRTETITETNRRLYTVQSATQKPALSLSSSL